MSQLLTAFSLFGLLALVVALGVLALLAKSGRHYMSAVGLVLIAGLVWQVSYVVSMANAMEE